MLIIVIIAIIVIAAVVSGSSSSSGSFGGPDLVAMYENNDCDAYHNFLKNTPMKEIKDNFTPEESVTYGKLLFSCGQGDTFAP